MSRPEREHPRYAHQAAITLNSPGHTISGRTFNVSRGGLCAMLTAPIAVGTDIELDIQLVFENDRHSEPLRIPARIVWCTAVDDGHQIGVQFLSLDAERAEYVTMFLRYLDEGSDSSADKPAVSIDERFG